MKTVAQPAAETSCSILKKLVDVRSLEKDYVMEGSFQYINTQRSVSQTQQNFITFIIVLGQHVSILIESSSGPSKIQILT